MPLYSTSSPECWSFSYPQAESPELAELKISHLSVSPWLVVASLEQGDILYLPALSIIQQALLPTRSRVELSYWSDLCISCLYLGLL